MSPSDERHHDPVGAEPTRTDQNGSGPNDSPARDSAHSTAEGVPHQAFPQNAAQAALAERLADPQVTNALVSLLDNADLIAVLVEGLDQFVSRSEIIGDSLLASIGDLRSTVENTPGAKDAGASIPQIARSAATLAAVLPQATPGLVTAIESGAIDRLLATGIVEASALDQVQVLALGLVTGSERFASRPVEVNGAFALMRLLRDPDIARALSYFATVAQAIGAELNRSRASSPELAGHGQTRQR